MFVLLTSSDIMLPQFPKQMCDCKHVLFLPLDVLLCLLYRRDGRLYLGDVLYLFTAPCTLV